jgi:putative SOS response-associated peptidase YedK
LTIIIVYIQYVYTNYSIYREVVNPPGQAETTYAIIALMCGAYGFSVKDAREVYDRFGVMNKLPGLKPRWNIRIGQMNPVIYQTADGVQMKDMYWSFLPSWAKEKRLKFSTFNARDDRLLESTVYKSAIATKRCIVPATHFFEPDKKHFPKPPHPWYCFRLKDQEVFGLAGLYNAWTDPATGEELFTYTIITTAPNAVVGEYHDREPAILPREQEAHWLNPDITEPQQVLQMLKPYPPETMESWRVSDAAKNPKNDYPEVILPYSPTP